MTPLEKQKLLLTFHRSLTERPLEPGDPAYVSELHQSDPSKDAVARLARQILFNESAAAYLFTGQIGTGKSTELRRLKVILEQDDCIVFLADMADFINLNTPIGISDLLIAIMGAFSDGIVEKYGEDPAHRSFWERVGAFLQTKVHLNEIGLEGGFAKLKFALAQDPDFKKKLQERTHGHLSSLVSEVIGFVSEARQMIAHGENKPEDELKIVLLLDSLERLRGQGGADDPVMHSMRDVFATYGDRLRIAGLHTVYSVPPYLLKLAPHLAGILGGGEVCNLTSAHIFQKKSRIPDTEGLRIMRKIVSKRVGGWAKVFSEIQLDRLVVDSGGDLREFFLLLKTAIVRAGDSDVQLPVGDPVIEHAEDTVRRNMLPLANATLERLAHVARTMEPRILEEKDMDLLITDLQVKRVLLYRNGEDWYDVHPLLRQEVNRYAAEQPGTGP